LTEALEAYRRALLADPNDGDAKHNLEVVAKELAQTPSPTPTPEAPRIEATPTRGPNDGEPGNADGDGEATAEPGAGEGTPDPSTEPLPADDSELTPEQLQRALDEALRGLEEEFTTEEALRVLDLLERQNRLQLEQPGRPAAGAPDY
jgi:hypothetical protein